MRAGRMRKQLVAGAAAMCMAVGSLTTTAGGQTSDDSAPLQAASGVVAPGGLRMFETDLDVNDRLTLWAANASASGGPDLRVRLQRWGFAPDFPGALAMVDVGTLVVPPGKSLRLDQVATTSAPHRVVLDAPGADVDVPFSIEPATTPGDGFSSEHLGQRPGEAMHIVATPPNGRDVRYLSEPAAELDRWRVDLAPGDVLAVQLDHLGFDRPDRPLVACLLDPSGAEVASATVGPGGGTLRYTVPFQGHYVIDMGCRAGAPTSAFRPYFTPRPGRIPGSTTFVGARRLTPKAGTQNGGALDRYWRIDLEAGQVLDLWYAPTDPEASQGTICIDGPPPEGGLRQVAAQTVPRGRSEHLVLLAPWSGRYVINGACLPGDGLFELYLN